MKKAILFAILTLLPLKISAQHLSFLGVPLNADISEFDKVLSSKGYTSKIEGESIFYQGGYFHDLPYAILIKGEKGRVKSLMINYDFKTYTEALGEYNDLIKGTEKKHPNYKKKSAMFVARIENGESVEYYPGNNENELLSIIVQKNINSEGGFIVMHYLVFDIKDNDEDL